MSNSDTGDGSIAEVIAGLPFNETIYLTLGTVMNQAAGVFHAVLEAAADLEMNVLVTTGPGLDAAAIGPLREQRRDCPLDIWWLIDNIDIDRRVECQQQPVVIVASR